MSESVKTAADLQRTAKEAFQKRDQSPEHRIAWRACERRVQQLQIGESTGGALLRRLAEVVRNEMASATGEKRLDAEFHMNDVGAEPTPACLNSIIAAAAVLNFGFQDIVRPAVGVVESD